MITYPAEHFAKAMPGQYPGISFEHYLRLRLPSQSILKRGGKSMLALKHAMDAVIKPTDAMVQGSALHCCFLEPELMPSKVALWTGARRAGNEWKDFQAANDGKAILTPGMHDNLIGMVHALRSDKRVREWSNRIEAVELSVIGDVHGVKCKGRIDALTDDPIWDLKKTVSVDDHSINKAIEGFGYDIQAYMYREMMGRDRFCLAFVEGAKPHDVRVVELSENWIKIGRRKTLELCQRYQHAVETGLWPGVSATIDLAEPTQWQLDSNGFGEEITLGDDQ